MPPEAGASARTPPPVVVVIGDPLFRPGFSIPRWSGGALSARLEEVQAAALSEVYRDGCVCVVGRTLPGTLRRYADNLGQRRADAIKAALCGEDRPADTIMRRLHQVEFATRPTGRWGREELAALLGLAHPGSPDADPTARIRAYQRAVGLHEDGGVTAATVDAAIHDCVGALAAAPWAVAASRIYSAMSVEGERPGEVEVWVFAERVPPPGSPLEWARRGEEAVGTQAGPGDEAGASGVDDIGALLADGIEVTLTGEEHRQLVASMRLSRGGDLEEEEDPEDAEVVDADGEA